MDLSYLKSKHGMIKSSQIVFQIVLSAALGSISDIASSSWISKAGDIISLLILLINVLVIVLALRSPIYVANKMLDIECWIFFFWIVFWILHYSFAFIYATNSEDRNPPIYNYELGFVLLSAMMMVQLCSVLVLMKQTIKIVLDSQQRSGSPRSSVVYLDEEIQHEPINPETPAVNDDSNVGDCNC